MQCLIWFDKYFITTNSFGWLAGIGLVLEYKFIDYNLKKNSFVFWLPSFHFL
jgi:hypothetical protein